MPIFQCTKCGIKKEAEYEACCTHAHCHGEKPPECCGQPMMEIMDD